jgi:hypothetical protein
MAVGAKMAVTPASPAERKGPRYQALALTGFAYGALVSIMWGAHNPYSGLGYETAFPYNSEIASVVEGFLYRADPLRIHTNTFYQLSYLMGEALGIGGSYVPFQVIYALLWWARGFLVFLLMRKFLPDCLPVCFAGGALVLVHSSDGALQWVGQLNQFGFIFWMLLAFYLLVQALEAADSNLAILFTIAACFFEYMSLWSYESQILILLVSPLLLLLHWNGRSWRKLAGLSAAWYCMPMIYIALTVAKYTLSSGHTYQESVMRKNWTLGSIMGDWYFNIAASLQFWKWMRGLWKASENEAALLSLGAAIVFVAAGLAIIRLTGENRKARFLGLVIGNWWLLLGAGFALLVLSFPVYLLLASARGLWRTQFLSSIGSGLVLTAIVGLVSNVAGRKIRVAAFLTFGAVIVYFGSLSAIQKGAIHRWIWERHRSTILQVLRVAPNVKANTLVVLVDVPKKDDPFNHNMWFDLAVRLVYPGIRTSGVYFYTDGTPSPGNYLTGIGDHWEWHGSGYPLALHDTPLTNTIVIDYNPSGAGALLKTMPPFLCRAQCATQLYNPTTVITGSLSPRAIRRYRPQSGS